MKILVIEDEEGLREALIQSLADEGYLADGAEDGETGFSMITSGLYDLVILDIMLPIIDGFEVLRRTRNRGISTPIILLTARSALRDKVGGMDLGADDYLTKPFAIKELLARIRSMTRRQPELSDSVLKFGNLSLDRSDYELAGPDGSTKLANKEFQIMEMLMTNPGQVISTERFLEKIWGYDTDAEVNVVWVYISTLRKKLASLGTSVQIKAARGVGYSLEDKA